MFKNRLRSLVTTLAFLLFAIMQAGAQTRERPTWFSFHVGHHEYHGEFGNELLGFSLGYDWTLGLAFDQYLNKYLDLSISANYGEFDYNNFFNTQFINSNALLRFKPVRNRFVVDPFIGTGIGITPFWDNRSASVESDIALHIPVQVGVDVRLTNSITATANATYNRTFSDNLDGESFGNRSHDDFMVYSMGIKIGLNKSRDRDGDGVKDDNDLCPDNYGTSFWGCPDTDSDGIDDDKDGCPTVAGSRAMNGCPDADGDGVEDSIDECPDVQGTFEAQGCPDNDNDGVLDNIDKCPDRAGIADNDGCPEGTRPAKKLDEGITKKLTEFSKSIKFDSSSISLDSTSQNSLDQLADIMLEDTALQLIIRAYTDNTGNPSRNLELSISRANAVKKYLVQQGVAEKRLYAFGYGEAKPVASNDTAAGRAKNRRVELNLYYN